MTASLPEGVVTFLFTDIEGSTRLLTDIGDAAYGEALGAHRAHRVRGRRGARAACRSDPRATRVFVAFPSAAGAVRAAVAAQQRARRPRVGRRRRPGPDGHPHRRGPGRRGRLRGHRGPPRGARRGGGPRRPGHPHGCDARRRGRARRRDRPARPRRAPAQGLRARRSGCTRSRRTVWRPRFPALKTLDLTPNNLPPQLTTFVGRAEVDGAVALLDRTRLLTLTGPGGTGKTRLSLALAGDCVDRYPDGTWFVPLASVTDPDLVRVGDRRVHRAARPAAAAHRSREGPPQGPHRAAGARQLRAGRRRAPRSSPTCCGRRPS